MTAVYFITSAARAVFCIGMVAQMMDWHFGGMAGIFAILATIDVMHLIYIVFGDLE